jgi:hypothetical protein
MNKRLVAIVLLALVGVVFLGQGVGIIEGSFMSGQATWAAIGSVLLGVALALAVLRGLRR